MRIQTIASESEVVGWFPKIDLNGTQNNHDYYSNGILEAIDLYQLVLVTSFHYPNQIEVIPSR